MQVLTWGMCMLRSCNVLPHTTGRSLSTCGDGTPVFVTSRPRGRRTVPIGDERAAGRGWPTPMACRRVALALNGQETMDRYPRISCNTTLARKEPRIAREVVDERSSGA